MTVAARTLGVKEQEAAAAAWIAALAGCPKEWFEARKDTHEWVVLEEGLGDGSPGRFREVSLLEAFTMGRPLAFVSKDVLSRFVAAPEVS